MNETSQYSKNILKDFIDYLLKKGWSLSDGYASSDANRYLRKDTGFSILLPINIEIYDFNESLNYALERVALYEKRTKDEILLDLQKKTFIQYIRDELDYRISDSTTEHGVIGLDKGASIIGSLKDLIIDAHRNEIDPRTFFPAKKKLLTDDYFKLGQTQKGSYIFRIETTEMPLELSEQLNLFGEAESMNDSPLQRKILERINYSMHQLEEAFERDSIDNIVGEDQYQMGLNANMCDSLEKLIPPNYKESDEHFTSLKFNYSPYLKVGQYIKKNEFMLRVAYREILKESSKLLKEDLSEIEGSFLGRIVSLDAKDSLDPETAKVIKIDLIHSDPEVSFRTFKAYLDVEQYANAVKAHGRNRIVSLKAKMIKAKPYWIADSVDKFEQKD